MCSCVFLCICVFKCASVSVSESVCNPFKVCGVAAMKKSEQIDILNVALSADVNKML